MVLIGVVVVMVVVVVVVVVVIVVVVAEVVKLWACAYPPGAGRCHGLAVPKYISTYRHLCGNTWDYLWTNCIPLDKAWTLQSNMITR